MHPLAVLYIGTEILDSPGALERIERTVYALANGSGPLGQFWLSVKESRGGKKPLEWLHEYGRA